MFNWCMLFVCIPFCLRRDRLSFPYANLSALVDILSMFFFSLCSSNNVQIKDFVKIFTRTNWFWFCLLRAYKSVLSYTQSAIKTVWTSFSSALRMYKQMLYPFSFSNKSVFFLYLRFVYGHNETLFFVFRSDCRS